MSWQAALVVIMLFVLGAGTSITVLALSLRKALRTCEVLRIDLSTAEAKIARFRAVADEEAKSNAQLAADYHSGLANWGPGKD